MKHVLLPFVKILIIGLLNIQQITLAQQLPGSTIAQSKVLENESYASITAATPDGSVGLLDGTRTLTKYFSNGDFAWRKSFSRFGDQYSGQHTIYKLIGTADGGFVFAGNYQKPAISSAYFTAVVKLNSAGDMVWTKEVVEKLGIFPDVPTQLLQTKDGGFLLAYEVIETRIQAGAVCIKLDQDGNIQWRTYLGSPLSTPLAPARIEGITETNDEYVLTGFHLPTYSINRTFDPGAILTFVDKSGKVVRQKSFYPTDRTITAAHVDATDNSLLLATGYGTNQSVLKTDNAGNILFRYVIPNFPAVTSSIFFGTAPNPQDGYVVVDTRDLNDFRLTRLSRSGQLISEQTFGGSRREDVNYALRLTSGQMLLVGATQSADGDLAGRSSTSAAQWVLTLNITNLSSPTPPPSGTFAFTTPSYDCNTGQLVVNTTTGNGSPIEYRILGNRDWATSNVFVIPAHQRQATTFTLEARQNGQVITQGFTAACGPNTNPQPPTPPTTPTNPSGFYLRTPAYDCSTGQLSALYSNGDGSAAEYRIVGNRDWSTNNVFTIPAHQRVGTTFTVEARLASGAYSSVNFTTGCGSGEPTLPIPPTPPTPPVSSGFAYGATSHECVNGRLFVIVSSSSSSPIEYRIPGLGDWQPSNVFVVPPYQRNGTTFSLFARQSGQVIQGSYTVSCPSAARVAWAAEGGPQLNAVVLPNPVVGSQLTVEVTGVAGQSVTFALSNATGRTQATRNVNATSDRHRETLNIGQIPAGLYLLRVSTPNQSTTVKVLKQ